MLRSLNRYLLRIVISAVIYIGLILVTAAFTFAAVVIGYPVMLVVCLIESWRVTEDMTSDKDNLEELKEKLEQAESKYSRNG